MPLPDRQLRHCSNAHLTLSNVCVDHTPQLACDDASMKRNGPRMTPPPKHTIDVCRDAACHIARGPEYIAKVREAFEGNDDIEVHEVSCIGRCEHAPAGWAGEAQPLDRCVGLPS